MILSKQFTRKNIIQNIAVLFSGSMVAQGMTALALLLTARQLGSAAYGQYAACFILASFTSIVFGLGLDIWLLREGGRDPAHLAEVVGSVFVIKLILGFIWLGVMLAVSSLFNQATFAPDVLPLAMVSVWLDTLFSTPLAAFKASLRNKFTSLLEGGGDTVWLIVTLALIATGERRVTSFIWVRIAVQTVFLAIALVLVARVVRLRPSLPTIKRAMRGTLAYAASDFLATSLMRVDVLIITLMLGDKAAGLYSPAVGIVNAAFLIPGAIFLVVTPVLSNLFTTDIQKAWATAKQAVLLSALVGFAATIGLIIIAGPIVSVLGMTFQASREVILILSIILIFHSIAFSMASIIVATGQQTRRSMIQAVVVIINAAMNFAVVRWAGINGVAMVYVISDFLLMIGYTWIVFAQYKNKEGSFARASVVLKN